MVSPEIVIISATYCQNARPNVNQLWNSLAKRTHRTSFKTPDEL